MKKQISFLALSALVACLGLASCNSGGQASSESYSPISLVEEQNNIWLDRYGEADISVTGGTGEYTYVSSDTSVVTVEGKRAYAQGKGTAIITVSDGKSEVQINVKVRDSGVKPTLSFKSLEAYLDTDINLPQEVSYNGATMQTTIEYQVSMKDPSVASFENGQLRGLKLGSTLVDVTATWKGLTLSKKGINLEVKEPLYISVTDEDVNLHNVATKLGRYGLDAIVYEKGIALEGAAVVYSIVSGQEHIRLDGNMVYALSEGDATIKASFQKDGHQSGVLINIHVGPNYEETSFLNPSTKPNYYAKVEDHPAGRDEVFAYKADPNVTSADCWESHIVEASANTKIVDLYRAGKRYFAYDLYYTSNQNLMVGCSAKTSWISVGDYFRKDYLTILKDGKVSNVLEKNTWVTMVYDLKALWSTNLGLSSYFFFFVNDGSTTQYLSNARFYLDDTFLPSENRSYEKKEGYTQATNDEFDVRIPTSKSYSMGSSEPGLIVSPEEVPEYGASGKTIDGVANPYSYQTKISSSSKNALVVSTSMNETYDDSLYRMSKLGSYFAFDIYPTNNSTLTFEINGGNSGYFASVEVGSGSLGQYDDWLVVYSGEERLSTLKANQWQTVVYCFADAYLEDCPSGQMAFSSADADDLVYINNCRYYYESDFLPNNYALEDRRPVANDANTSVERKNSGDLRGSYEIKSTKGESSVYFNGVSEDGEFFSGGYRYLKYELYVDEGVSSIKLNSHADSGLVDNDEDEIEIGKEFTSEHDIYDSEGVKATTINPKSWYTVYQKVAKNDSNLLGVDVSLSAKGKSNSSIYIRYVDFAYELYTLYLRNIPGYTDNVSLSFVKSGDFAGSFRYSNGTSGDVAGEAQNWGESGVRFSGVAASDDSAPGAFFRVGYHWIKTDVYIEDGVPSFSIRVSGDRNLERYWPQDIAVGKELPADVYATNMEGKRATVISAKTWYTLMIPVKYASADTGNTYVTVYSNGGSKAKPSVMYFRNIEYLKEADVPEVVPSPVMARTDFPDLVSCVEQSDGTFLYSNGVTAENSNSGVYFNKVTDPKASTIDESTGSFFDEGYHYIKMGFKLERGDNFRMRVIGFPNAGADKLLTQYIKTVTVGSTLGEDILLYEENGAKASTLQNGVWYDLYIPVIYDEGYVGWTDVLLFTTGGSQASPNLIRMRNIEFLKTFDK